MGDIFVNKKRIFKRDGRVCLILNITLPRESVYLKSDIIQETDMPDKNAKKKKMPRDEFIEFYDNLYLQLTDFCTKKLIDKIQSTNILYRLNLKLERVDNEADGLKIRRTLTLFGFNRPLYSTSDFDLFKGGLFVPIPKQKRKKK